MEQGSLAGSKRPREGDAALPDYYRELWILLPRGGALVGNGPFIPCKPPLRFAASEVLDEGDRFDAGMFMDKQVNARRNVGLVVALTDPSKGIPTSEEREWEDWDAEFKSISPVTAEQVAQEFIKIVRAFSSNAANSHRMVAVYCEDGTNLCGYAIVSYMHQVLKKPLSEALADFASAKAPGIFHAPYIQDLYTRFATGEIAPPAPAPPAWTLDPSKLVPARGAFVLPAARPGPLPVLPAASAAAPPPQSRAPERSKAANEPPEADAGANERLPSGWTKHWSKTHNRSYYFNKATGKQMWDPPPGGSSSSSSSGGGGGGGGGGGEPTKMGALHILYKHQKSRKPASWKDKEGDIIKARTVNEAQAMLQRLRDELVEDNRRSGTKLKDLFAQRARTESDCSSAHKGGDLGMFDKGKMQPPFEKATLATKIGEISPVIESDSGVHIIFRYA